jgi:hypothetical protein
MAHQGSFINSFGLIIEGNCEHLMTDSSHFGHVDFDNGAMNGTEQYPKWGNR